MGGLSFNTSLPYPEFDLTERLLQLAELDSFPLFTLIGDFHRYNSSRILLHVAPPTATLVVSKVNNPDVRCEIASLALRQ